MIPKLFEHSTQISYKILSSTELKCYKCQQSSTIYSLVNCITTFDCYELISYELVQLLGFTVQYDSVLTSLGELAENSSPSAASANPRQQQFSKGNTVLGLVVAETVIGELECLNTSLQRKTQTISGMHRAVGCVQSTLRSKINDDAYQSLFERASYMGGSLDLEPITMPQIRKPPKHLHREADVYRAKTPMEHYRVEYYKVLDIADSQLAVRFQQDGQKPENTLLTGKIDSVVDEYPEINTQLLAVPCSDSTTHAVAAHMLQRLLQVCQ